MNIMTQIAEPDYGAIKTKQNAAWSSGDYRKIGVTLQITGEELAETADVAPGSTVLDVAAGNGNATLAFAAPLVLGHLDRLCGKSAQRRSHAR